MASPDEHHENIKCFGKRYYKALRAEQKSTAKLIRLRQELYLAEFESNNNTRIAEAALRDYANAACRRLCRKIYATFSREVRDIIYVHLLQDRPYRISDDIYANGGIEDWGSSSALWLGRHTHNHLTKAASVGTHIVRELEEVFLRTTTFLFPHNSRCMSKFRLTDHLKLGLIPADFILNVQLQISCGLFDLPDLRPISHGNSTWDSPDHLRPEALAVRLEDLFGFRHGSKITVDLDVDAIRLPDTTAKEQWLFDNVVPLIFASLRRLIQAGYKLKVILGDGDFVLRAPDGRFSLEQWTVKLVQMQDNLKRREEEQDAIHYSLCADNIFDLPTTQAINSSNDAVAVVGPVQDFPLDVDDQFVEESSEEDVTQGGHFIQEARDGSYDSGVSGMGDEDEDGRNEGEDNVDSNNVKHDSDEAAYNNPDDDEAVHTSGETSDKLEGEE
ncbi:hypothetical protein HBI56_056870 [Parastagonospora nodorum]|nr:hypothetical protein HBI10_069850 [Parastagonospora nodorum]KAH4027951.1 hypothetical protein HBI13_048150 [Parastagonospora nodorum]KAH4118371.1 hypothetical protein HBH47_141820 [Parastagonospora nodorum]KAH4402109.1 hypothetical protein HBH92_214680 [Parastagonospora nodorum]KAH4434578.1 hypothetical protein HBH93_121180 [Parastagonospora nodorum]